MAPRPYSPALLHDPGTANKSWGLSKRLGRSRLLRGAALLGLLMVPAIPAQAAAVTLKPGENVVSLSGDGFADGTGTVTFVVPTVKGQAVYLGLQARTKTDASAYRARLKIEGDGDMFVGFSRTAKAKDTVLSSVQIPGKAKAGQRIVLNANVTGSQPVRLAVRAWLEGTAKPAWQNSYSDTSSERITGTGRVGVWAYLSGSATASSSLTFSGLTGKADVPTPTPTPTTPAPTTPAPTTPAPTTPAPTTPAPTTPAPSGKPSAATTGVPSGTQLTRHDGNIVVTKDGTTLDRMDIYGFVDIKAKNVTISNSRIHGATATGNRGVITNYGYDNLLITDTNIDAANQSVWVDGIKGWDFTVRRVHIVGGVDSIKIHGDNVTVEDSLLESTNYFANDPNQGGGPTHNDNIQILTGMNLSIVHNTIRDGDTHTVLATAQQGNAKVAIVGNWLDGAICNVKMQTTGNWTLNATVKDNKFGPNLVYKKCMISQQKTGKITLTASGNVLENTPFSPVGILME